MTTDGHLDRVLDRWLSEGPSIVPDRVIDAALAEVPTTRQRGAGWLLRGDRGRRVGAGGRGRALRPARSGTARLAHVHDSTPFRQA